MSSCGQQRLLEAYQVGELAGDERARFEEHLRTCDACATELERLRTVSQPLRELRRERPTPQQWGSFHRAIDRAAGEEARSMRLVATLSVLAASVLMVGLAWLRVLAPVGPTPPGGGAVVSTSPSSDDRAWERVATTLQPDPLSLPPEGPRTAEALQPDLADWMLEGLAAPQKTDQR
jgi:anti-sigma factor RsiW